jgi:hypothetical protein
MTYNESLLRHPADVIRAHLAQYLGPFTAKNALQMVSKGTLSIDADRVVLAQVPGLLEALGPTLRTLLGKEGAANVVAQIQKELTLI